MKWTARDRGQRPLTLVGRRPLAAVAVAVLVMAGVLVMAAVLAGHGPVERGLESREP